MKTQKIFCIDNTNWIGSGIDKLFEQGFYVKEMTAAGSKDRGYCFILLEKDDSEVNL